jgi:hypothetical protein
MDHRRRLVRLHAHEAAYSAPGRRAAGGVPRDSQSIAWLLPLAIAAIRACENRPSEAALKPPSAAPILLFGGAGTSPDDVAAVDIHEAVQKGLGYLGICAGAFLAGRSTHYPSFALADVQFGFYADETRGVRKAAVTIAGPGTPTLEQYWEDGPQLGGWGAIIGRYPDGTPAIVEGASGGGWVLLTGVHPEAPSSWRRELFFTTPVEADHAYAATLVRAALDRKWLPYE